LLGATGTNGTNGTNGTDGTNGTSILVGATEGTTAQASTVANGADAVHAVLGVGNSISFASGTTGGSQVSLTLTNGIGNTHGVLIQESSTVIAGGTHSTTLTLADTGASFANAQTGAAIVVSGVANGVADTDAANVVQVKNAIEAAVTPLAAQINAVATGLNNLEQHVEDVEAKLSGGIAMTAALTQPVSFAPDAKNAITGGISGGTF